MNICVLTHTFPKNKKDTTAAFMEPFCLGLAEAGNKVIVLAPFTKEINRTKDKFKLIKYKYIWPDSWHKLGYSRAMKSDVDLKPINYLLFPFMFLFGTISLIKIIKKYKIDIVNVHWIIPNGLMAFMASKISRIPYVITVPGTDAYLVYRSEIVAFIARVVAKSSAGVISNSKLLLKRITDLNIGHKTTGVISYPVDVNKFKVSKKGLLKLRKKLSIKDNYLIITAIGRLVYKKGYKYLIFAMPEIIKKHPKTMLVIGGDGDLKQDLLKIVKKLKVEKNVKFVGNVPRDETLAFFNLADVFVAPSIVDDKGNVDGGPVVSYEAMACGKAQVVTDILGVSSIIKNGINGYVVSQKNSKKLTIAINKLLVSKNLREQMGRKNRLVILKSLNTKFIGIKYNKFFKEVIKNEK